MTSGPRPLVAGNWKMHGLTASLAEIEAIGAGYAALGASVELVVCPPATLLAAAAAIAARFNLGIGGQDCDAQASGAHTGDLSAEMLADAGASYVIVGHSERRAEHGESDALVRAKASAALRAGLTPIVCVGETRAERDAGRAIEIVERQLAGSLPAPIAAERLVVAYEPIWAIGTGLTPTTNDVTSMHAAIRARLDALVGASAPTRILYGGSVKPSNARELLHAPHVDGALVGGASLTAKDFLAIAEAAL
ncbi:MULTISPECIES: triose-phosphate isomerase [Methylosinus]|uniref:Triosephosphate isomerase n=1 Tax=Methylosinus trichosporium (strain ATCC 35070 / NCIMB 11131 / UNIQEM 75 / OB3b) TaxID=595536 RepID=A0A2D2CV37_METT3|nr:MULTISPECIES: triose-phosphate isomerase [Methylosinus]ATQ66691.1 triose-phosphate isomerase [Methylosinus trichosporium OB3b]OBS53361.1 triose-phosphate isomerase [Methylosinus sp. 3S-1]